MRRSLLGRSSSRAIARLPSDVFAIGSSRLTLVELCGTSYLEPAVAKSEARKNKQIKRGGGEQPTQDDDCHRTLDFTSWSFASQCKGQDAKRSHCRGHQDWQQTLRRAAQ